MAIYLHFGKQVLLTLALFQYYTYKSILWEFTQYWHYMNTKY